jgi:hypothetical protein
LLTDWDEMNTIYREPSIDASYQTKSKFVGTMMSLGQAVSEENIFVIALKPPTQMNWNLVGSIYRRRSSIKIAHFVLIRYLTWPPQAILVFDRSIFNNILLLNRLAWSLIRSIYRRSSLWPSVSEEIFFFKK